MTISYCLMTENLLLVMFVNVECFIFPCLNEFDSDGADIKMAVLVICVAYGDEQI